MKKKNLLRKNYAFQDIIEQKQQVVSKFIVLYYQKNNQYLKVGITTPKRMANAVLRNLNKRRVKAIIRNLNILDLKYNVVLIIRKSFIGLEYLSQYNSIKMIFERLLRIDK